MTKQETTNAEFTSDMLAALQEADSLVTKVINGEPGLMRQALALAGTLSQLRRKHGIKTDGTI